MNPGYTRRDFLKLVSAMSLAPLFNRVPSILDHIARDQPLPNIIIILYDALSAFNLSVYGYHRKTSPNLVRFASRATVYHNHHSAGNFTTPSTASLFTGTYPWTHRAFNLSSLIRTEVKPNNIFRMLKDSYHLNAFSQNIYSDMLLYQFEEYIQHHQELDSFTLAGHTFYNHLFPRDAIYGMRSYDQFLFVREEAHGSLFLSLLDDLAVQLGNRRRSEELADMYPEELPRLANTDVNFRIDQVTDGVKGLLDYWGAPSLSYIHFMPPHAPYVPSRQYAGMFDDGWSPPVKKRHRLAAGVSDERMYELRHTYDEYVANLDEEFGQLFDHLEETGLLDSSYVIFTSDHGELFERGATGHSTPLVFEPVVRIPLIISAPGQQERKDIYVLTSNVDLCPTIMRIAGLDIPGWCEGQILPGLGGGENLDRSAYIVEAKANPAYEPFRKATLAILKGQYKLIQYLGYRYYKNKIECFDLKNDPDELNNLYPEHPMARELWEELQLKIEAADQPFIKKMGL